MKFHTIASAGNYVVAKVERIAGKGGLGAATLEKVVEYWVFPEGAAYNMFTKIGQPHSTIYQAVEAAEEFSGRGAGKPAPEEAE